MTMDEPQRIYVEDEASGSNASPITVPVRGEELGWHYSSAKPFITSITSSDENVLSVQRITSPSYWVSFAPFELVPVSVGTTTLTVADCYGKTYTSTVTVNPSSSVDPGVTVNSVGLVRYEDWESVSKGTVTMNIGDPDGVKLAADIDANGDVDTNWTSSNPEIAEVVVTQDENGDEICQVKPVRASYDEQNKTTADCRITVTVNGSVSDYCTSRSSPLRTCVVQIRLHRLVQLRFLSRRRCLPMCYKSCKVYHWQSRLFQRVASRGSIVLPLRSRRMVRSSLVSSISTS